MDADYDVAIIGAGCAGLVAARELGQAGLSVVVLEARDRIGGRCWTDTRFGVELEMGAGWVHWCQPHVWAELTRYGLAITRSPAVTEAWWQDAAGSPRRGSLTDFTRLITPGQEQIVAWAREALPVATDPLACAEQVAALDQIDLATHINSLGLNSEARAANEAVWVGHANCELSRASLLSALRWAAATGGHWELMHEASATYRIVGGTQALVASIAADVRGEVRLNTRVTRVTHNTSGTVLETASEERLSARYALITLPGNAIQNIVFEPQLSAVWQRRAAEKVAARGAKLWLKVAGRAPRFFAYGTAADPISVLKTEFYGSASGTTAARDAGQRTAAAAEYTVLVAFGADSSKIDITDTTALQRAVDRLRPGLRVLAATWHNWMDDPLSAVTWMISRPGQFSRDHAAMLKAEGRIRYATTDNANLWAGFIDGAIESGLREAGRIRELFAGSV